MRPPTQGLHATTPRRTAVEHHELAQDPRHAPTGERHAHGDLQAFSIALVDDGQQPDSPPVVERLADGIEAALQHWLLGVLLDSEPDVFDFHVHLKIEQKHVRQDRAKSLPVPLLHELGRGRPNLLTNVKQGRQRSSWGVVDSSTFTGNTSCP